MHAKLAVFPLAGIMSNKIVIVEQNTPKKGQFRLKLCLFDLSAGHRTSSLNLQGVTDSSSNLSQTAIISTGQFS